MTNLFRDTSPGALTLEQAVTLEKKRQAERKRQARELAAQGRSGDTEMAHVAPGEFVVPALLQTPELLRVLRRAAAAQNISFDSLRIGNRANSINPETGLAEFAAPQDGQPYYYGGPPVGEVTTSVPKLYQLPQNTPNSGFYNYGTPGNGEGQYGNSASIGVFKDVGAQWHAAGLPPFGVGNMSKEYGEEFIPHGASHRDGSAADVRPIRRDGRQVGSTTWKSPDYDRAGTQRLIDTLRATGGVDTIYFNDPDIKGVTPMKGHDDHMHVKVNPSWKRR